MEEDETIRFEGLRGYRQRRSHTSIIALYYVHVLLIFTTCIALYDHYKCLLPLPLLFPSFIEADAFEFDYRNHRNEMLLNSYHSAFPVGLSRFGGMSRGGYVERSNENYSYDYESQEINDYDTSMTTIIGKNQTSVLGTGVVKMPHREMRAYRISFGEMSDGIVVASAELVDTTKSSLAERLECPLRDLRIMDHVCHRSGPAFLSRKNCIIIHVGHLRCIIERDSLLIFLPLTKQPSQVAVNIHAVTAIGDKSDNAMEELALLNDLVGAIVIHLNAIFGTSIGYKTSNGNRSGANLGPNQLFELVILEVLLGHISLYERLKARNLVSVTNELLDLITTSQAHSMRQSNGSDRIIKVKKDSFMELQARLGTLLQLKNQIDQLEAICTDIAAAISEVLRNDDDMMAMLLSRSSDDSKSKNRRHQSQLKAVRTSNLHSDIGVDDVELLFEDYLLQIDETISSLRAVQSNVRNTEEVVVIELDLVRNRIMKFELLLEMTSLVVGCGALVRFSQGTCYDDSIIPIVALKI